MDIKTSFLMGLLEPKYSRVEFWQIKQRESGYSPIVYWRKLNEVWQDYYDQIETQIRLMNSWGNSVTDNRLSLFSETNGMAIGHIGRPELEDLHFSLFHYGFELKQNMWFYEYKMDNIHTSKEYAPAKQFPLFQSINESKFVSELKALEYQKIAEFLDLHFRCYERKIKKESNIEELQEKWLEYTKKIVPSEFSIKQKDAFLLWFEKKIPAEIEPNEIELKAPVIRLFCSIIHQSGIFLRGFEESAASYCERICTHYGLRYTERVRQHFSNELDIKKNDPNLNKVINLVLPKLPNEDQEKIQAFINHKTKMYG